MQEGFDRRSEECYHLYLELVTTAHSGTEVFETLEFGNKQVPGSIAVGIAG